MHIVELPGALNHQEHKWLICEDIKVVSFTLELHGNVG